MLKQEETPNGYEANEKEDKKRPTNTDEIHFNYQLKWTLERLIGDHKSLVYALKSWQLILQEQSANASAANVVKLCKENLDSLKNEKKLREHEFSELEDVITVLDYYLKVRIPDSNYLAIFQQVINDVLEEIKNNNLKFAADEKYTKAVAPPKEISLIQLFLTFAVVGIGGGAGLYFLLHSFLPTSSIVDFALPLSPLVIDFIILYITKKSSVTHLVTLPTVIIDYIKKRNNPEQEESLITENQSLTNENRMDYGSINNLLKTNSLETNLSFFADGQGDEIHVGSHPHPSPLPPSLEEEEQTSLEHSPTSTATSFS